MDSFEFNKIAGAVLGTVLALMVLGIVTDALFATPTPEKPGYVIDVAEAKATPGGDEEKKDEGPDVLAMIGGADVAAGQRAAKKCVACHTFEKGGANKVGPNLWNIVNRKIAVVDGFKYSGVLSGMSDKDWSYDHLNQFLTKPKDFAKGTTMGFAGVKKAEQRAALLAYLRSLADEPAALPGQ